LPEEKGKVYTRFETSGPGVLYQHDSSHHMWLPLTGQRQVLILTEDDYSRRVLGGRIVRAESTWEHLVLTRGIIGRYGRPLAYYVDNHSIFRYVGYSSRHYKYLKGPDEGEIQFKRALEALNIGLIYTGKGEAQAKGKNDLISYYNDCREHQETGEIPSKRWENAVKER